MDTSIPNIVGHVTAIDDLSFYRRKCPVGFSYQELSMETVSALEGMLCAPNHLKKDLLQPNQILFLSITYVALSAFMALALVKVMKGSESDCKTVALSEEMAKCCRNVLPLYFYTDYIGSQMLEVMAYPVYNGASKLMSVFGNADDGQSEHQFVKKLMSLPAEEREARMKSEAERLKTYGRSLWPIRDIMSPEELAAAGFYYTGIGTCVQCAFCHNELSNWEHDDNPRVEHRQQYPNCPLFVKRRSGNVKLVNERSAQHHQFSLSTLSGRALSSSATASTSANKSPAADQCQSRDVTAHRECSMDTADELQGAEASASVWSDNSLSAAEGGAAASEDHSYHDGHGRCHRRTTRHSNTHHEATRHNPGDLMSSTIFEWPPTQTTQAVAMGAEIGHQGRADIDESRPVLTGLTEVEFIHEMRDSSLPSAKRSGSNQAVLLQVLDDNELDDPGEPLSTLHRAGSSAVAPPLLLEAPVTSTWAIPLSVPAQVWDGLTDLFHEPQPHFSVQATSVGFIDLDVHHSLSSCQCCRLIQAQVTLLPCRHVMCRKCELCFALCSVCGARVRGSHELRSYVTH